MKKIVYLFILLNSEKNEPRSAAAVIGLLGLSLRSPSGGLRNSLRSNSPRPFPSVSLASSPPDKGGIGDCALACILTPSPYGHSPYLICDEQGERIKSAAPNLISSGALWVSPFSPMLLRNIGETQKKQSFLRKGIRGMKRQSPPISY